VEILRYPGGGWPFHEREYRELKRSEMTNRSSIERLVATLRSDSIPGMKPRNHPVTLHFGILQLESRSGEHFYIYYAVERDKGGEYVSINANSAGSTNPNGAKHYESTELVGLLRREDPWFPRR
jgi:hypothetical protein